MNRISAYFALAVSLTVFASGCSLSTDATTDLFQYKDSYVGDNSAVHHVVKELAHNAELQEISLATKQAPYGITLSYKDLAVTNVDKEMKETVITNSTFLFALIQNVDQITFQFPDKAFTVTKEQLQAWYGNELTGLKSEQDVRKLLQEHANSETAVNQFFQQ